MAYKVKKRMVAYKENGVELKKSLIYLISTYKKAMKYVRRYRNKNQARPIC